MDPTRVTIAAVGYVVLWVLTAVVFAVLSKHTKNPVEKRKLSRTSAIVISILMVGAAAVAGAPIGAILLMAAGCAAFLWIADRLTKWCQACGESIQRPGTVFCPKCGTRLKSSSEPSTSSISEE